MEYTDKHPKDNVFNDIEFLILRFMIDIGAENIFSRNLEFLEKPW